ncbi:MAG TPA: precorrin-6y C5,15-methyltransferase (decarboxylating) subunit CbiE [Anaeromyxobacteraceae bacterium]|nr:precorrin-6y C5,15-methyltransferase (decarboxylating) subunit CbiE [Anaeromyxobacteraceae bacterium]
MNAPAARAVTVVGVGDDGRAGLSPRALAAIAAARAVAGGARHLALFPEGAGERIPLGAGLDGALSRLRDAAAAGPVCVLASGDPLFFGIGARVAQAFGAGAVEFLPQPSSMQWAFARLGIPWDGAALLSCHGRPRDGLVARLRRRAKAALFTDAESPPPAIAAHLLAHGEAGWTAHVCERLGGDRERIRSFRLEALAACEDVDPLNVLVLVRDAGWRPPPVVPFLPEAALSTRNGLVTKREVRVVALAALRLAEDSVLWDVGAGSGSVSIEAGLLAPEGRVFAVERDAEMLDHLRGNVRRHGADNVRVVEGSAPGALAGLDTPDAVFVGGSGGDLSAILGRALDALRPGGRIVVNAALLDTLEEARRLLAARGLEPEVTLVSVARGAPVAGRLRLDPLAPVHVVAATTPAGGAR